MQNNITSDMVWKCLKTVQDPELNESIVDMGLIYKVEVNPEADTKVFIQMTLTTPACPLAGSFQFLIFDALRQIEGLDPESEANIELTFDPPWTQDMMTEELQAKFGFNQW